MGRSPILELVAKPGCRATAGRRRTRHAENSFGTGTPRWMGESRIGRGNASGKRAGGRGKRAEGCGARGGGKTTNRDAGRGLIRQLLAGLERRTNEPPLSLLLLNLEPSFQPEWLREVVNG